MCTCISNLVKVIYNFKKIYYLKTNILFVNYQSEVMKVIHNKRIDIINK